MVSVYVVFFVSSRRRHTRCALVTGVQTCALPIYGTGEPVPVYYNGYAGGEHIQGASRAAEEGEHQPVRAARLGIDDFAATPIQGRGVLVNLRKHFGDERHAVGSDDLMQVLQADPKSGRASCRERVWQYV